MISRIRWVGIALLALPTVASVCLAAEDPIGAIPGHGGISGSLGLGYFGHGDPYGDPKATFSNWSAQYSMGAEMRLSMSANFRYVVTRRFRWQVSPGFSWAGYQKKGIPAPFTDPNFPADKKKDDYLTLLLPMSAQLQIMHPGKSWLWHFGAGPGFYRLWVENHRKVLADPTTFKLHRGVYPGGSFELGAERFVKSQPSVSVEFVTDGHLVFAKRDNDFVSGLNSNVYAMGLRIGINYYFQLQKPKKSSEAPLPAPTPTK